MISGSGERLGKEIDEVRKRLEDLMMDKGMTTDKEVVILSQELDQLIIQYYTRTIENEG